MKDGIRITYIHRRDVSRKKPSWRDWGIVDRRRWHDELDMTAYGEQNDGLQ